MPVAKIARIAAGLLTSGMGACPALAQTAPPSLATLHAFLPHTGTLPQGTLAGDPAGNLSGATELGGAGGYGVVYALHPPAEGETAWTEQVLVDLAASPAGGLLRGSNGTLFGATSNGGGSSPGSGNGTIYRLTPPTGTGTIWRRSILYTFGGGADGAQPTGALITDGKGGLYGQTRFGGALGNGTVYQLAPPAAGETVWTKKILYNFGGAPDGADPWDTLAADTHGALYGVTLAGGTACAKQGGCGTVYKLTPPASGKGAWTEQVIASLYRKGDDTSGSRCGTQPNAVVVARSGVVYGTTGGGCNSIDNGSVYELLPPTATRSGWKLVYVHSFTNTPDGQAPFCALTLAADGSLYGTTAGGGSMGDGTIFKLAPPAHGQTAWTETLLYQFTGPEGENPLGPLIFDKAGNLYGPALEGGNVSGACFNGCGTLFRLTP